MKLNEYIDIAYKLTVIGKPYKKAYGEIISSDDMSYLDDGLNEFKKFANLANFYELQSITDEDLSKEEKCLMQDLFSSIAILN